MRGAIVNAVLTALMQREKKSSSRPAGAAAAAAAADAACSLPAQQEQQQPEQCCAAATSNAAATTAAQPAMVPAAQQECVSHRVAAQEEEVSPTSSAASAASSVAESCTSSSADSAAAPSSSAKQQQLQQEPSQPGVMFWTDGRARHMPVLLQAVAMLTLLVFLGWIYLISFLMLAAPFSKLALTLCVATWATLLLPCHPVMWKGFMGNWVMALWRRYFSFAVCYEEMLDPHQHYLFADYPHGAFPLSQLLGLTVRHLACWKGERFYGMAADSVFRIPMWRHVYTWLGIVPASAANLRQYLKWGSVGITPGGIAEMYLAGGPADHIYIKGRKGFVAVAVEEGVDIVPVYHLGGSQALSFGPRFCEPWGRKWRFSLGILHGVAWLPIPHRTRLLMLVGAPVKVVKTARSDPAFQSVVDATHQAYMDALRALYDKHKGRYGWADHPLIMH